MSLNPHAQLVRVKTDLLGYINITHEVETDDYTWGEIKKEWTPPKPSNLLDKTKLLRTTEYKLNEKDWKNHNLEVFDDDDVTSIIKQGGLVYGMAGTGKSTTRNKIKETLAGNTYLPWLIHIRRPKLLMVIRFIKH